jgi:hypothetical protein
MDANQIRMARRNVARRCQRAVGQPSSTITISMGRWVCASASPSIGKQARPVVDRSQSSEAGTRLAHRLIYVNREPVLLYQLAQSRSAPHPKT